MNKVLNIIVRRSIFQNTRLLCSCNYQIKLNRHINNDIWMNNSTENGINFSIIKRFKHQKKGSIKKAKEEVSDSDEEENEMDDDDLDESHSKSMITNVKVNTLRIDAVAKAAIGMTRKKVEEAFYEGKIYLNGKKLLKISTEININDEIDIVRSRSEEHLNQLIVSRVKILSINAISGAIRIRICRDKNLLIEDYSD